MSTASQKSAEGASGLPPWSSSAALADAADSTPWGFFLRLALAFLSAAADGLYVCAGPAQLGRSLATYAQNEAHRRVGLLEFALSAVLGHANAPAYRKRKSKRGAERRPPVAPHDLRALAAHAIALRPELASAMPQDEEGERLFALLCAGYLKTRYSRSFAVSPVDGAALLAWAEAFVRAAVEICQGDPARPLASSAPTESLEGRAAA